ncbi:MAG: FtsX-like permease family protein, partial [Solobacterium sp.]|nr:FtsX-like permease family protein [Solobacterium sp.]
KIKAAVKHYVIILDGREITEGNLAEAILAVRELSQTYRDKNVKELLREERDQFGSSLKEFADLLEADAEGIHTVDLDALLGKESRKEAGKALKTILSEWTGCGHTLNDQAPLEEGISQLLAALKQIEADYPHISSETEFPPDEMFLRYLREEEVISPERYELARKRCTRLYELIQKYHLREIAEKIAFYTSWTWREALELAKNLENYADELEEITETKISTVGDFVYAYDKAKEILKEIIRELTEKRKEIIEELRKAGIEEKEIDDTIRKAEEGIEEIDEGLRLIEDGLRQIQEGLDLIDERRREADEAIAKIGEALAEIDDGLRQIDEGLQEAAPLEEAILSGLIQIEEGLEKIRGGRLEIETGLAESREKIRAGKETLVQKEKETEEEWARQLKEFENLGEELKEAFASLEEAEGYEDLCNQFLIGIAEGADPGETLKQCEKVFGEDQIKESYVFEDSDVNRRIHDNTDPIQEIAQFMPVVFYIVIITVVFLFMSLLVRMYRREIGIYMALGFSGGSIRGLFALLGLLIALGSFLPGLGIGWILIRLISGYFRDFFPLPFTVARFDVPMLLPALLTSVIAVQISTWIGTSLVSRIHPSEAMARFTEPPPEVPKILDTLLKPARELEKYAILTLLRNPLRFLLSVICISATSILIYSSMSFLTSKDAILRQMFDQRIQYDCEVYVAEGKENEFAEKLKKLDYVSAAEPSGYYFRQIEHDGKKKSVLIGTAKDGSSLISVRDSSGNGLSIPESGIVLDLYSAETLGVKAGDKVNIDGAEITVTGLSDQYISRIQYLSARQAEDLGKEDLGVLLVRMAEDKEQELKRYLSEEDGYLYVIFTHSLKNGFETLYETYDLYAWILVGFAVVIGLLIVLNITAASLIE